MILDCVWSSSESAWMSFNNYFFSYFFFCLSFFFDNLLFINAIELSFRLYKLNLIFLILKNSQVEKFFQFLLTTTFKKVPLPSYSFSSINSFAGRILLSFQSSNNVLNSILIHIHSSLPHRFPFNSSSYSNYNNSCCSNPRRLLVCWYIL